MKFIITAGGTREYIDPVRYITNASTGKMGYALAHSAVKTGAEVVLITAPSNLQTPQGAEVIKVNSSSDMFKAVKDSFTDCDCLIMSAAVSDYTPAKKSHQKLKKNEKKLTIQLKPTTDILKWAGENKKTGQFIVGFALETKDILKNAEKKLISKKIDMIIANSAKTIAADHANVSIKRPGQDWLEYNGPKPQIADNIINLIIQQAFPEN